MENKTIIIQDNTFIVVNNEDFTSNLTELYDNERTGNTPQLLEMLGFENKKELMEILEDYYKEEEKRKMKNVKLIKWYNEDEKGYVDTKEDYKKLISMINSCDDSVLVKVVFEDEEGTTKEEMLYLDNYNLMYDEEDYIALKEAFKNLMENKGVK